MMSRLLSAALLLVSALSACTIVEMRRNVKEEQVTVGNKQDELQTLQTTNSELTAQKGRLQSDLQQRTLNASELRTRLDEIIRLNAAAAARSASERAQQQDRQRQLQTVDTQARTLEQDTTLGDAEKHRRLAELQEKTRQILNLLLAD